MKTKKGERKIDVKLYKKMHFKRRLKERYGIKCNKFDIKKLNDRIKHDDFFDVEKQSNTMFLILIDFMDQIVYIAYSRKHNTPVTALPIENYVKRINKFRIKEQ